MHTLLAVALFTSFGCSRAS